MIITGSGGAYIYQGNSIVVPQETPDSLLHQEINRGLVAEAFSGIKGIDTFTVASLDGQGDIHSVNIPEGELPLGWKAIPLRPALSIITGGTLAEGNGPAGRILRSYHVCQWRKDSRFCGTCGGPNRDAASGDLARQCPSCGRTEFPRISPAVIFIVINGNGDALLAHNKNFLSGIYSVIAGFNEAGESLEETIVREAKEEVNLEVDDIRYVRSQPWPFPNSLMIGFSARSSGGEPKPDGKEIEDARWFSRDQLPELPGSASVSRYLINLWLEGKL